MDFLRHLRQRDCDIPTWIMRAALRQMADVTDVVAFAVLVTYSKTCFLPLPAGSYLEGLQDADAVIPPAA